MSAESVAAIHPDELDLDERNLLSVKGHGVSRRRPVSCKKGSSYIDSATVSGWHLVRTERVLETIDIADVLDE